MTSIPLATIERERHALMSIGGHKAVTADQVLNAVLHRVQRGQQWRVAVLGAKRLAMAGWSAGAILTRLVQ